MRRNRAVIQHRRFNIACCRCGCQVAHLSALKTGKAKTSHFIWSVKHNTGTEVKCNCLLYRSSPNICQHALTTAEDLQVLSDYLLWVKRTKKGPKLSQLIASSVAKKMGDKNLYHNIRATLNKRSLKVLLLLSLTPASGVCTTSFMSKWSVPSHDNHIIGTPKCHLAHVSHYPQ